MMPRYTLEEIKLGVDRATWQRAVGLYETGAVKEFQEMGRFYEARVQGGKLYQVVVDSQEFDKGDCSCYLGQRDILCKHMIAVAIYAIKRGKPLSAAEKNFIEGVTLSREQRSLTKPELIEVKLEIKRAMRDIRPYLGPSRIWFAYQNRLTRGCRRLCLILRHLPINLQTTKLIISVLLRLDRRLGRGGVDDSDGTVGGFIEEVARALAKRAKSQPEIIPAFKPLAKRETSFGWEDELVELTKRKN